MEERERGRDGEIGQGLYWDWKQAGLGSPEEWAEKGIAEGSDQPLGTGISALVVRASPVSGRRGGCTGRKDH